MNRELLNKTINVVIKNIQANRSVLSNLIAGAGMAYAVYNDEKPKYYQVPIAFIFPSMMYTGYHLYKNKDKIYVNGITL